MFKDNKGVTLTALVVTIIVILILSAVTISTSDLLIKDTKSKTVATNMYLVKAKAEDVYEKESFSNETLSLPGVKKDVGSLGSYGVTPADGNVNLWYEWNSSVLASLGLDRTMLSGSNTFIVNYESGEVIYSAGVTNSHDVKEYKLTDIVK